MAGTVLFKNTARNAHRTRYVTNVDNFSSGMRFTDAPHAAGYAKSIVNFDIKNDGECLIPRGGLHMLGDSLEVSAVFPLHDYCIHHASAMFVKAPSETSEDVKLCKYYIVGASTEVNGVRSFDLATSYLVVENAFKLGTNQPELGISGYDAYSECPTPIAGALTTKPWFTDLQGFRTADGSLSANVARDGIFTSLEGNTYVFVHTATKNILGRLVAQFKSTAAPGHLSQDWGISWWVEEVSPTEIQPTQAMNYGYNMWKDNPYTFVNSVSGTGAVQLTGVIPYAEDGTLLLTARPGTPIIFKLYYKYPQADVDNGDKYLVQWEVQDLNNSADPEVIKKVRGSTEYTPGSDISFAYTPSYTAFSIIVRLYKKSEIASQDAEWENDPTLQALITKDEYLTPNQVTTLASYYLTSNANSTVLNLDAVAYNVATATGMCTWQQRLVVWGVTGAKTTLFVSEVNDPGYMPYPNNCEIFTSDIICAVPYLSSLLVFTKDALYKLTYNDDGLSYTSECIQSRLNMEPADTNTVLVVQNMVYFKSGNFYYMIVPNTQNGAQTTQLAPVSRAVEQMFNSLPKVLAEVLNSVYNFTADSYHNPIQLTLLDYSTYVANTQVRNVYKLQCAVHDTHGVTHSWIVDACLNYDTVLRAWTIYLYQAGPYRMCVYTPSATGEVVFAHLYALAGVLRTCIVQADSTTPNDDFPLDVHRELGNWQFIDTGYRDFSESLKKRFREIQFSINVLNSQHLYFHTTFTVDDVDTTSMYKYVVTHITDPADPNYGDAYVDRVLDEELQTPALTEFDTWELDAAAFPDITVHKVRFKVAGKGYGGAVQLLSKNELPFELLYINWVYRVMFAR